MKRSYAASAALLLAVAVALAVAPLAVAHRHASAVKTVTVGMTEFKFALSTKTAPHGKVTFKVTNKGKIAHDFKIAGKKTKLLQPRQKATLTVTLTKGRFPYKCTVDSHAKFGMKGVFKAT